MGNALSREVTSYLVCIGNSFFKDDVLGQWLKCQTHDSKSWAGTRAFHRLKKTVECAYWVVKKLTNQVTMHESLQHARSLYTEWVCHYCTMFMAIQRMTA